MKKVIYLIIFFVCCNTCCKKQDEYYYEIIEQAYEYTLKDYFSKTFKVYEGKDNLCYLIDSVVEMVQTCALFRNTQICQVFSVDLINDSINIYIEAYDYRYNDILCYDADALFFYKGYSFIYRGMIINDFFVDSNETVERDIIKPIEPEYYYIDDTMLTLFVWEYMYANNKLKTTYISKCYEYNN